MIIMISETIYQEEEKMDTKNYFVVDSVEKLEEAIARTRTAQQEFSCFSQEQVDRIFLAAASAANKARIPLAKMAVEETGMGIVEDKVIKNNYASEYIYNAYKDTKTCGVIEEDKAFGIKKIAEPIGVIAAVSLRRTPLLLQSSSACLRSKHAMPSSSALIPEQRTAPLQRRSLYWKLLLPQVLRKESSTGSTCPRWNSPIRL